MEGVAASREAGVETSLRHGLAAWRGEVALRLAPELAALGWAFGGRRRLAAAALALALVIGAALPAVQTIRRVTAAAQGSPEVALPRPPAVRPPAAITAAWLASAGPFAIERLPVAGTKLRVDLTRPPAAVGHTTECSFECAMRVFRRRHAPNFLVGRDARGKVRIVQFVPLGRAATTMRNLDGGVETNRWARVQVELVARSRKRPWSPDPQVLAAFAHLAAELRDVAGIPLTRPFTGASGAAGTLARRRGSGKWGSRAGWFSHAEVPENDHWDMGAFRWARLFAAAERASARSLATASAARERRTTG